MFQANPARKFDHAAVGTRKLSFGGGHTKRPVQQFGRDIQLRDCAHV